MSDAGLVAALYVVSAPSGAGKTSLVREALARNPRLRLSVSYTTRPRRPAEQEGRDYFFVDRARFQELVAAGALLEHASVFDHLYGTSREQVQGHIGRGHPVILEIDWQGARQVRCAMPEAVLVFVLPPSRAELERRLRGRGSDPEPVIERRLRDAEADMGHYAEFDYVIVNDAFDQALAELEAVLAGRGAALGADRPDLRPLLQRLLARGGT